METLILKLAIAAVPLIFLVTFVTIITNLSSWHASHPLAWHRTRRSILHTRAGGLTLR